LQALQFRKSVIRQSPTSDPSGKGGSLVWTVVPKPPLPPELNEFLAQPNAAVIASVRPDGSPHSVATWYLWEDGRVLVNMDEGRKRLEYMSAEPRVSITVLAEDDTHVTLQGHAVVIEDDPQLEGIDRLSTHYTGESFGIRDRGRVNAWIEVDSWHKWP
jgi:PPOX class probable F420-dependent enzyme